jgi:hypothetical protein
VDQVVLANETTRASKITSKAVTTTSGNELVLAFIGADGPTQPTQNITAVSGGGLHWSLAVQSNSQLGTAEVWQAFAASPPAGAKITAALHDGGYDGSITIATFTGADTTTGAHAAAAASTGSPSVSLTTTKANALMWAAGHDWQPRQGPHPGQRPDSGPSVPRHQHPRHLLGPAHRSHPRQRHQRHRRRHRTHHRPVGTRELPPGSRRHRL